jgi:hypothetical protein
MDGVPSAYEYGEQAAPEYAHRRPIIKPLVGFGPAGEKGKKGVVGWSVRRNWESKGVVE